MTYETFHSDPGKCTLRNSKDEIVGVLSKAVRGGISVAIDIPNESTPTKSEDEIDQHLGEIIEVLTAKMTSFPGELDAESIIGTVVVDTYLILNGNLNVDDFR